MSKLHSWHVCLSSDLCLEIEGLLQRKSDVASNKHLHHGAMGTSCQVAAHSTYDNCGSDFLEFMSFFEKPLMFSVVLHFVGMCVEGGSLNLSHQLYLETK